MGLAKTQDQYLTGRTVLNCSEETAAQIDQVVKEMLKKAYEEALQILSENRDVMDGIAAYLIEKETITGKEFMEIYRRVKGISEPGTEAAEEETVAAGTAAEAQAEGPEEP